MAESALVDFVGEFNADVLRTGEPVPGRVLLSEKRLVLAPKTDERLTIPLGSVVDVVKGNVPPNMGDFFDPTVTVAFERDGANHVVAVEGDRDAIDALARGLYTTLLEGVEVRVRPRDRVGGRLHGDALQPATIELRADGVAAGDVVIRRDDVVYFERGRETVDGRERPAVAVTHVVDGRAVRTVLVTATPRQASLLGRFVRVEYADRLGSVTDSELDEPEKELLTALYATSGGTAEQLAPVVETDVRSALPALAEDDLATVGEDGTSTLTRTGQVAVHRFADDVDG